MTTGITRARRKTGAEKLAARRDIHGDAPEEPSQQIADGCRRPTGPVPPSFASSPCIAAPCCILRDVTGHPRPPTLAEGATPSAHRRRSHSRRGCALPLPPPPPAAFPVAEAEREGSRCSRSPFLSLRRSSFPFSSTLSRAFPLHSFFFLTSLSLFYFLRFFFSAFAIFLLDNRRRAGSGDECREREQR